jgi:hypothetical protein
MDSHFESKGAMGHLVEKRAEGMLSLEEGHGVEMPDVLSAACESGKEMALVMLLTWLLVLLSGHQGAVMPFVLFGLGLLVWKTGRRGWLGWARLERLHRLIEQERYEVEHHRPQEREELVALYSSKGFEGKLLEDVVDVLMADQDRLLTVMLEEEMGLTLEAHQHPLQQALGAALGGLLSFSASFLAFYFFPKVGISVPFLLIAVGAAFSAWYKQNRIIQAVVWNISLAALSFASAYFLCHLIL